MRRIPVLNPRVRHNAVRSGNNDAVSAGYMVQLGRDRVQISPWRESTSIANLVPFPAHDQLPRKMVARTMSSAIKLGYREAHTAAMSPRQAEPFLQMGFSLLEELHLLRRTLLGDLPQNNKSLRRARRGDWDDVLKLDALAFDDFWQFDRENLATAIRATPRHRFHVTRTDPVVGYHVTGLAARHGYIQRIAVHPDAEGQGWGSGLVADALTWAQRHGAQQAHVNTQLTNERALHLYQRHGFELASWRLQVLRIALPSTPPSGSGDD